MLSKTNLEKRLAQLRDRRVGSGNPNNTLSQEQAILDEVQRIFLENDEERTQIRSRIVTGVSAEDNALDIDLLNSEKIFHKKDIKKLCIDYRLRFLESHRFKGDIPEEAISRIRELERDHGIQLQNLKIMAPAKLMKLENADDPLLFAPMGNDYYYLIHKWGKDMSPFRKLLMWPYKNFENLLFAIFLVSLFLTWIAPMQAFTKGEVGNEEYLMLFLFMFKAVGGTVLYYGFAKGKNFNNAIWDSKYYNG
ncbi:MAG: hypothetical protein AAF466_03835 [Bacteroidota bacterium]